MSARASKLLLRWTLGLGLAVGLTVLAASCTGQGEGQRCQVANGNDDCQSGLVCYKAGDITLPGGGASNADICCPADRTASTEDICKLGGSTPQSDAAINDSSTTKDTGTSDATTDGATTDGSTGDATTDGSTSDAATDGSSDATGQ